MPIYEYTCQSCNKDFEELVFDDTAPTCPFCGSQNTQKLMSRCAFTTGGDSGSYDAAQTSSGGGCAGCSGGNCASCGR